MGKFRPQVGILSQRGWTKYRIGPSPVNIALRPHAGKEREKVEKFLEFARARLKHGKDQVELPAECTIC